MNGLRFVILGVAFVSSCAIDARPDQTVEQAPTVMSMSTDTNGTLLVSSVGSGSCAGEEACKDASGNIGANSCNGTRACEFMSGDVADNSCNGFEACRLRANLVGNDSCNAFQACTLSNGDVGDSSCNADSTCSFNKGHIGNFACNVRLACRNNGEDDGFGIINDSSCNGLNACTGNGRGGLGIIGAFACNGESACTSNGTTGGSGVILDGSCNAASACPQNGSSGSGTIWYGSCNAFSACFTNGRLGNGIVRSHSCNDVSACASNGDSGSGSIWNGSCNGSHACDFNGFDGDTGTVRDFSCNGTNACRSNDSLIGECQRNLVFVATCADTDLDGVRNPFDSCPNTPLGALVGPNGCALEGEAGSGDLVDSDGDGIDDGPDNCDLVANSAQTDSDGDGQGDACDDDDDNDAVTDAPDNCDLDPNPDQTDTDSDGEGNACDADDDNDGVADAPDNCDLVANTDQADTDGDALGNACDADDDNDGFSDSDEAAAGSDPLNPASVPELCDFVDNDLDSLVDDGFPSVIVKFERPVNDPALPMSVFKAGSTVTLRFKLFHCDGSPYTDTEAAAIASAGNAKLEVTLGAVSPLLRVGTTTTTPTAAADRGNTFRYDAATDVFVYNWGTKGLSHPRTYSLAAIVTDPGGNVVTHAVTVGLR